jgi:O-antigen/teichoic acid export membrane protein
MHNLIKNTGIYALGDIIPRLLSFITFPVLTRYLVPEDYAIVSYANTINMFLMIISFLCLNTYYLVFYYRMGEEKKQKELLGNITIFVVGINLIFSVFLLLFGKYFFSAIGSSIDFFPYIMIAVITNFFNIFGVLPAALFRVQERPLPFTLINVIKGVLTMGITLVLVVVFGYKALGVLTSTLAVSVIFFFIYIRITLKNAIWNFNFIQIKEALAFSLPLIPGSIAAYASSMLDRVFIEKYLNLFDLGIYSVAATIAMMLNIVSHGAYKAFEPYIFKIYGSETFTVNFVKIHNAFLALILFGAMVLSIFAKEFLQFFAGPGYQMAYYYVPMIMVGVVFFGLNMLFGTVMNAEGKTKLSSIITIIGGLLSCILNIVLLPIIGLPAAGLASGMSFGLILVLRICFVKIRMNYWISVEGLFLASVSVWFLVYIFSSDQILLGLIVKSIAIAVVMVLIMLALQFRWKDITKNILNIKGESVN